MEKKTSQIETRMQEKQSNLDNMFLEINSIYESQEQSMAEQGKLKEQYQSLKAKYDQMESSEIRCKLELQKLKNEFE